MTYARVLEDKTNLYLHARHNAQEAVALAKQRAQQFDVQAASERKTNEALQLAKLQATADTTSDVDGRESVLSEGQNKVPVMDRA